jgi:hypothetical protein
VRNDVGPSGIDPSAAVQYFRVFAIDDTIKREKAARTENPRIQDSKLDSRNPNFRKGFCGTTTEMLCYSDT